MHILKVKKFRKASWEELRVRSTQFLAILNERLGESSLTRLGTDEELLQKLKPPPSGQQPGLQYEPLEMFRKRSEPKFFAAFTNREATVQEFRRRLPDQETKVVERANSIVLGKFDLLGFHNLNFGKPIDWHLEPISGKQTPRLHWSKLNFLDARLAGDKKIIWELNRHQYFITLGQAYWLTNDEKYAETFIGHVNSWMDHNPPKLGINWASSLELAFRSISWIWALYFFRESPSLDGQIFRRMLKFLFLNARHLETYLSTYFSPNTHLTGEALGLFYLGMLLPEFKESGRWRKVGLQILTEQLPRHVRPDGVYFEQSSYYHRYTTDFYLHLFILLRTNGHTIPLEVEEFLLALLDHLMYITRPDGSSPLFGDDDGGRLMPLGLRASNDFRATVTTGATLFGRADYKYVGGDVVEEALWLLGANGLRELDFVKPQPPARESVAFEDGGYYVMRDGWTRSSNYLWFDCGPHGTLNCGHAHADALSLELATSGRPVLVDPGTYTYTGSKEMRDWFRSSMAHNTITIDGESSSVSAGPFSWKTIGGGNAVRWVNQERFDFVQGEHNGYARLSQPAEISRSILFLKHDYWIVRDQVATSGEHRADLWFHFDAGINPQMETVTEGAIVVRVADDPANLDTYVFASHGSWRSEVGWVSHCYGERVRAPVYVFSATVNGCFEMVTFFLPQPGLQNAKRVVREVQAIGGLGFEVIHENGVDIVMIRSGRQGGRAEIAHASSDFEWTWARFSNHQESLPEEVVLLDGHNLELQGREILKSERRIKHLAARRLGDKFRVETDEGILDLRMPISNLDLRFTNSHKRSNI